VIDSVKPLRTPVNVAGRASGHSIHLAICAPAAPSTRAASKTSRSMLRRPSTVDSTIGKKTMTEHSRTTGRMPYPTQITSSGANATAGMACEAAR